MKYVEGAVVRILKITAVDPDTWAVTVENPDEVEKALLPSLNEDIAGIKELRFKTNPEDYKFKAGNYLRIEEVLDDGAYGYWDVLTPEELASPKFIKLD